MNFNLPELGEGVYEAELVAWRVRPGETVKPGQVLMDVLTDKATMEVPAPFHGTIASLNAEVGKVVKVGDAVLTYDSAEASPTRAAPEKALAHVPQQAALPQAHTDGAEKGLPVKAAPSVRLLARKLGVDLAGIRGSGPQGRILVEDLSHHVGAASPAAGAEPLPFDLGKPGTRIKMQGIRRKIADHMVHSKRTAAHYSYVDECDVSEMVRLRSSLREPFERAGVKITYLAFLVKAAAGALKDVPMVNATFDDEAGEIVLHERINVGIAVATPQGLMAPVIRDADRKSLLDTAREVERLSAAARTGKAKLEDLRGGGFTVTSIGNLGGLISTPVLNYPEVGIMGAGKVVPRPMYNERGELYRADTLYLSFSFDHRVLDGAIGAVFGNAVIRRLKNCAAMLAGLEP